MPEEWLQRYYETGDVEALNLLVRHFWPSLDRFLRLCVYDLGVRTEIMLRTMHHLRQSGRHPELHWDTQRGKVDGFMFGMAGHLAYRWLVWFEDPREMS